MKTLKKLLSLFAMLFFWGGPLVLLITLICGTILFCIGFGVFIIYAVLAVCIFIVFFYKK